MQSSKGARPGEFIPAAAGTWGDVRSLAATEFRWLLRRRDGLLVAWVAVSITFAVWLRTQTAGLDPNPRPGVPVFGWYVLALLTALTLLTPRVSDPRPDVTRAGLYGQLLASYGIGLVFLAAALPPALATVVLGGAAPRRLLVCWLVLAGLLAVFVTIRHAARLAAGGRTSGVCRYYAALAVLSVGTFVAAGPLLGPAYEEQEDGPWWLLAPNPYAILAEAVPGAGWTDRVAFPPDSIGECFSVNGVNCRDRSAQPTPTWPYGLAGDAALAGGALALTARRVRRTEAQA